MNTSNEKIAAKNAVRTPGGGFNTPISKRELQEIGEQFPGQRVTIITAKHPNRSQRRAQYKGDKVNNRKMSEGRVVYRTEQGQSIPGGLSIGKKLKLKINAIKKRLGWQ